MPVSDPTPMMQAAAERMPKCFVSAGTMLPGGFMGYIFSMEVEFAEFSMDVPLFADAGVKQLETKSEVVEFPYFVALDRFQLTDGFTIKEVDTLAGYIYNKLQGLANARRNVLNIRQIAG